MQGGPGFNVAKFLNFFLLITFAYCFVKVDRRGDSWDRLFAERLHQRRNEQPCRLHWQRFDTGSSRYDSQRIRPSWGAVTVFD